MRFPIVSLAGLLCASGHGLAQQTSTLLEARQGFTTHLLRKTSAKDPLPTPPADLFQSVQYPSPAGNLAAYLTPPTKDGKKRPAIVWIFGGFSNGIGDGAWASAEPQNDQSARAFREAGIVMMYPSLRGGNQNPGVKEGFYGEVTDVLAARDFLAKQPHVDPARIYLGGHSTGGTLALLAAASSNQFRAVIALGPVEDVSDYGQEQLPFDVANAKEVDLRSPIKWLGAIHTPTFVLEGAEKGHGNIAPLRALAHANHNPLIHFQPVPGKDHFSAILPVTKLFARKILADTGANSSITLTEQEVADAVKP